MFLGLYFRVFISWDALSYDKKRDSPHMKFFHA